MEWRNWGHRCSTGFFSSAYLQAWWITTNQTYRKRKLSSIKTVIIVQFSFLSQQSLSLAFTRLAADSRFPASVSCLTHFWLLHNSLSFSLPIFVHAFLFVIMICGRGVGGWAGRRTSCLFALACAAALSFFSSLCLHAHGAVERCRGWRGRLCGRCAYVFASWIWYGMITTIYLRECVIWLRLMKCDTWEMGGGCVRLRFWLWCMMSSFGRNLLAGVEGTCKFFCSFPSQSRFFKHVFNLVDFVRV